MGRRMSFFKQIRPTPQNPRGVGRSQSRCVPYSMQAQAFIRKIKNPAIRVRPPPPTSSYNRTALEVGLEQAVLELVIRAQKRDPDAFAALISRFERTALAVALAQVRDAHQAGDAVQEGFLR